MSFQTFQIDSSFSPLTKLGFTRLQALWANISNLNLQDLDAIYFASTDALDEYSVDLVKELEKGVDCEQLAFRIMYAKNFLRAVSDFPLPCYFFCRGDCIGFFWEWALACEQRFFLNSEAVVGCPEIGFGYFPAYGVILKAIFKKPHNDELQKFLPKRASHLALTEFLTVIPAWVDFEDIKISYVPRTLITKNSSELKQKFTNRQHQDEETIREGLAKTLNSRLKVTDELNWTMGQLLLVFRSKKEFELVRWYLFIIFSRINKKFLQFINEFRKRNLGQTTFLAKPCYILCDISEDIPSIYFLKHLIEANFQPVFVADNSAQLCHKLNLLRRNFAAGKFSESEVAVFFNKCISWLQRIPKTASQKLIFKKYAGLKLESKSQTLEYLNLLQEREFDQVQAFSFEKIGSENCSNPTEIQNFLDSLSFRIGDGQKPLSSVIRCIFLYQIFYLSRLSEYTIARFLEVLHYYGWGFSSRSHAWNNFLSSKRLTVLDFEHFPEFLEFDRFKEFLGKQDLMELNALKIRPTREQKLGIHQTVKLLEYFTLMLFNRLQILVANRAMETEKLASFLDAVLGLPLTLRHPAARLGELGLPMISFHLRRNGVWLNNLTR